MLFFFFPLPCINFSVTSSAAVYSSCVAVVVVEFLFILLYFFVSEHREYAPRSRLHPGAQRQRVPPEQR